MTSRERLQSEDDSLNESAAAEDESTGLPGFRTWPRVYAFVLVSFVVWVALLTLLSRAFS
jgi:hypothetical protein